MHHPSRGLTVISQAAAAITQSTSAHSKVEVVSSQEMGLRDQRGKNEKAMGLGWQHGILEQNTLV